MSKHLILKLFIVVVRSLVNIVVSRISNYGNITANFIFVPSFWEKYGNTISIIVLGAFIILPALFSARPTILSGITNILVSKKSNDSRLLEIDNTDILGINVAVITGVLIFLSLEGFDPNEQSQINLITANIVFHFAISAIATLLKFRLFGIRFMIVGFVNLMISVILIVLMRF
jgi:hypothetical protein